MRKAIPIFVMLMGILLLIAGFLTKIPSDELTTYSWMRDECSVVEEYVGGDAYNYIIGASLVSGHIAGAETQRALFIAFGVFTFCFGLTLYPLKARKK